MLNQISLFLSNLLNKNSNIITILLKTIILGIIIKLLNSLLKFLNNKINFNDKQKYIINKRNKTILTIIYLISLIFIWNSLLKNIITFISFMSAAITLAAREIIYNYFAGIYIKLIKPIKVEDRISMGDYFGDVININNLNFEILEVNKETNQSTGKIIHIPNSLIFNTPLKNYNKAFKYIWDEIDIRIDINSDINLAKKILTKIISQNKIIKEIPKKMQEELKNCNQSYRIYFNNYNPIVYTKIFEDKYILTIRFLIHPKKQRYIESEIFENIIQKFKQTNIILK